MNNYQSKYSNIKQYQNNLPNFQYTILQLPQIPAILGTLAAKTILHTQINLNQSPKINQIEHKKFRSKSLQSQHHEYQPQQYGNKGNRYNHQQKVRNTLQTGKIINGREPSTGRQSFEEGLMTMKTAKSSNNLLKCSRKDLQSKHRFCIEDTAQSENDSISDINRQSEINHHYIGDSFDTNNKEEEHQHNPSSQEVSMTLTEMSNDARLRQYIIGRDNNDCLMKRNNRCYTQKSPFMRSPKQDFYQNSQSAKKNMREYHQCISTLQEESRQRSIEQMEEDQEDNANESYEQQQ